MFISQITLRILSSSFYIICIHKLLYKKFLSTFNKNVFFLRKRPKSEEFFICYFYRQTEVEVEILCRNLMTSYCRFDSFVSCFGKVINFHEKVLKNLICSQKQLTICFLLKRAKTQIFCNKNSIENPDSSFH